MKKLYIIATFLILSGFCSAQSIFQDLYGDTLTDRGNIILKTSDGGYCIVGASGEDYTDSTDISFYRLNVFGDLINSYKMGLIGDDKPTGIVETADNGFIIVGTTYASPLSTGHSDMFAIKIDFNGSSVFWSNVFGGTGDDEAHAITMTPDSNFLIIGSTTSFGSVTKSALMVQIDINGDALWSTISHVDSVNEYNSVDISYDNKFLLGGTSFNGTDYDQYVFKADLNGSMIWANKYSTTGSETISEIKSTSDNGFITVGLTSENTAGDTDRTVMKCDSAGSIIWVNNYGTPNYDEATSVLENTVNHFIVCGTTYSISDFGEANQLSIEELDSAGNIVWATIYGSLTDESRGSDIILGSDGGYAATGLSYGGVNGDAYFVKVDQTGFSGCYENADTLIKTTATLVTTSGATDSIITVVQQPIIINNNFFIDQFAQNCFDDQVISIGARSAVKLFPNPAVNSLQIESLNQNTIATIYDLTGNILLKIKLAEGLSTIDISSLSAGIYFVQLNSPMKTEVSKFTKVSQ